SRNRGERLLDQNVLPRQQSAAGHVEMRRRVGADDDRVDTVLLKRNINLGREVGVGKPYRQVLQAVRPPVAHGNDACSGQLAEDPRVIDAPVSTPQEREPYLTSHIASLRKTL